ncbi:fluoride efflux transporter FluC [Gordonia zhaorongruii]|uniref:fluoride efflux transporter FluC n=1 Tax=Gordonia zhaorongruii TaxID=2597659 RepID=UPI0010522D34|nr:CrcB family protein [Gordonia zhaorongruii]
MGSTDRTSECDSRTRGADLGWVFLGGLGGTALRWSAEEAWPLHDGHWPVGTTVVNVMGAFLLGLVLETLVRMGPDHGVRRRIRLAAGTGFCGALTTYSAFALELSVLGKGGHVVIAVAYALVTVLAGIAAVVAGIALARRLVAIKGGDEA